MKPSIIQRWARGLVINLMKRFDRSPLRVTFPDQSVMDFGKPATGPRAELHIHNDQFFSRVLTDGEIGFGEGYMEGDWTTPDLPLLIAALIDNFEHIPGMSGSKASIVGFNFLKLLNSFAHWRRRNTPSNSRKNISAHYDLSNDFYALWLDETMTYSSAWFDGEEELSSAQEKKYHRLATKLQLKEGMSVLEIGCGWGGFSLYAAKNFGVNITAITISQAQFDVAQKRIQEAGLSDKITLLLKDYRHVQGSFDAIVSIEMLEAVGHQFLKAYFAQCHKLLKPNGRLGLQVIICPDSRYDAMRRSVDWIKKHIFPGGQLPSVKALLDSVHATGDLYLHHLENFGLHYAKTLQIWRDRFHQQQDAVRQMGFDDAFLRKWDYYLAYCEAAFATRNINVSQLVLSRPNNTSFTLEQ